MSFIHARTEGTVIQLMENTTSSARARQVTEENGVRKVSTNNDDDNDDDYDSNNKSHYTVSFQVPNSQALQRYVSSLENFTSIVTYLLSTFSVLCPIPYLFLSSAASTAAKSLKNSFCNV